MAFSEVGIVANPFVVGSALSDPQGRGFFGREDVLAFVGNALNAVQRSPVILYGHRRIGKSSILRRLVHQLPPEVVCVYYDLQDKARNPLDTGVLYGPGTSDFGSARRRVAGA